MLHRRRDDVVRFLTRMMVVDLETFDAYLTHLDQELERQKLRSILLERELLTIPESSILSEGFGYVPDPILADLAISPEGIETVRQLLDDEADTVGMWYFDALIEADKTREALEKYRPQTIETDSKKKSRKRRSNLERYWYIPQLAFSEEVEHGFLNRLRQGDFDYLVDFPEVLKNVRESLEDDDKNNPEVLRYFDLLKSIAEERIVPERPEGQGQRPTDVSAIEPVGDPSAPSSFASEESVDRGHFTDSLSEMTKELGRNSGRKAPEDFRHVLTGKLLLLFGLTLLIGIVLGAFFF